MRPSKRSVVTAMVFAFCLAATALGQSKGIPFVQNHERLKYCLVTSMKSEIPGIVESTIFNTMEYKNYYPNLDFSSLIAALERLSQESTDSMITYKAQLAIMYLRYGATFEDGSVFNADNHETAFQLASEQLTRKFLFSHATQ